jgi:hypothetical protein
VERTLIPAGSAIPWSSLEVNETEAATAATLCFDILRGRDAPVHIRTSALQDLDEFTMAEQTGLHSLTSHTNSDILTKGEWGKKRMHHLIVEACRPRVNTGHHTPLEDSTGHLLLLTPLTWSHTPVTMSVMYGPNWKGIAAAAAADRGRADQTLKLTKLQAAQRVLLDECRKTPIHIESASIINEVIHLTGPTRTTDPSTDSSSLSHSGRQQHPYNSTAQGLESATALEALTDLLRQQLIVATPHQEGLLLSPHIPSNNPTNGMQIDGHPRGEDGVAANKPS